MKIKKITASNFKSFSSLAIEDFLSLNFIFGFNNSGKSNLLKLIDVIFSRKIETEATIYETKEGSQVRTAKSKSNFWEGIIENHNYIFRFGKSDAVIDFSVTIELKSDEISSLDIYAELIKNEIVVAGASCEIILEGKITSLGLSNARQELERVVIDNNVVYEKNKTPSGTINIFELLALMNDSVLFIDYDRYFKPEFEEKRINELTPGQFKNWLFNLTLSIDRNNEFNELLSSVKGFKINSRDKRFAENEKNNPFNKDFNFRFGRRSDFLDVFFRNGVGEMPLDSFGTGTQQIIYLIFKLFEFRPKILLIEEIELNLSPKYQDILVKFFEGLIQNESFLEQVFITSHSPLHCYRSQDRSFRATINNSGETTFEKFILSERENKRLKSAHDFLIKSIYSKEQD